MSRTPKLLFFAFLSLSFATFGVSAAQKGSKDSSDKSESEDEKKRAEKQREDEEKRAEKQREDEEKRAEKQREDEKKRAEKQREDEEKRAEKLKEEQEKLEEKLKKKQEKLEKKLKEKQGEGEADEEARGESGDREDRDDDDDLQDGDRSAKTDLKVIDKVGLKPSAKAPGIGSRMGPQRAINKAQSQLSVGAPGISSIKEITGVRPTSVQSRSFQGFLGRGQDKLLGAPGQGRQGRPLAPSKGLPPGGAPSAREASVSASVATPPTPTDQTASQGASDGAGQLRDDSSGKRATGVDGPAAPQESFLSAAPEVALESKVLLSKETPLTGGEGLQAQLQAAKTRMLMKEWPEAAAAADRVLAIDPRNVDAALIRAEVSLRQGDALTAEQAARSVLERDPQNAQALLLLGRALYKRGQMSLSLQAVQAALETRPNDAVGHRLLAAVREALAQPGQGAGQGAVQGVVEAMRYAVAANPLYQPLLERARRGERIGYPEFDEDLLGPEDLAAARPPSAVTLGAGLGAVALALIGGWVLLRRRRSAAIDALCRQNVSLPVDGPRAFAERYEVLRPLLRDVHGEILEARDRTLDRRVEIRRLHAGPDAALRERGLAAARTAAGLKHPAIAAIYEVAQEGPHVLVVREWLGGKTARAMLKEGGRLPLAQALLLLRRACEAVAFAHGQGVTHQWLSPESVVVTDQGEAKVSDFGLMPAGASPGEAGGLQDVERRKRGDVHDLAVCLYELVTGAKPFPDGAADGSAGLGLIAPSIRVPGLPPALDEILSDALAATPEPRIQSPAELLARLGEVQEVAGKR